MRPMVSIIVPIYNAEQYLRRCVDSILNQEYTDYDAARFAGFTEEELIKYAELSEKIKENTKNILYFLN